MPVRAAGGHHQAVGDGGLSLEVDEHDILRLVVVETGQDQVFQGRDAGLGVLGSRYGLLRARRNFTVQRVAPL
jgi:hypothetical protein